MLGSRSFAALVPALLLTLLLLACGAVPGPPPAATATPTPRGAISIDVDRGISIEDQLLVQNVANESRRFYERHLGRNLKQDITIEISARRGGVFQGYASGRRSTILTGGDGWPKDDNPLSIETKATLVAHELFHNFQWDLTNTDDAIPSRSPWWLREGTAEYAAKQWAAEYFGVNWDDYRSYFEEVAAGTTRSLDSNTIGTTYEEYAKAFLAVDDLMAGRTLKALGDYFTAAGTMEWEDAFRQTFNQDPNAYIAAFESSRR